MPPRKADKLPSTPAAVPAVPPAEVRTPAPEPSLLGTLLEFNKGSVGCPEAAREAARILAAQLRSEALTAIVPAQEAVDTLICLPTARARVTGFEKARAQALAQKAGQA